MTGAIATALDITNHDLYVVDGHIARLTNFAAIVAQRIKCRLLTVRGEWYQDPTIGVPLFEQVLVKNPDLVALQHLFTTVIQGVEGVARVRSVNLQMESATRNLRVTFEVTATDGTKVEGGI